MSKLILKPENSFCCYSHHATRRALIFHPSKKQFPLNVLPFNHSIKFRVSCRVKEKEKEETGQNLGGLLENEELDQKGTLFKASSANELEAGNWPPWKNLPQRYKLIGTTSLAFIICNMDKVLVFPLLLIILLKLS